LESDDEAVSSDSESKITEEAVTLGDNSNVNGSRDNRILLQHSWNSGGIHPLIAGLSRQRMQEAPSPCGQRLYTNYHLSSIIHGSDTTVGSTVNGTNM
jgi:hypothetical protein